MPPKLHNAFSTGLLAGRTFGDASEAAIFEHGFLGEPFNSNRDPDISTNTQSVDDTSVPRSVALAPHVPVVTRGAGASLQIRQLWEGTVTEVNDVGFVATLTDKTNPTSPDERGVFEFDSVEVPADDRALIAPGAVFYWVMGMERKVTGQQKSVSALEFRRLPVWSRSAIASASVRASEVKRWFNAEATYLNGD